MSDPFASPATATGVVWEEIKGHLLLIDVKSLEEGVQTTFGIKDAIRGDVADVDTGDEYLDTLVFPMALIGQLRPNMGKKVLGRLTQGNAKPGQKPPWKLEDPTEADKAKARAWIDKQSLTAPF